MPAHRCPPAADSTYRRGRGSRSSSRPAISHTCRWPAPARPARGPPGEAFDPIGRMPCVSAPGAPVAAARARDRHRHDVRARRDAIRAEIDRALARNAVTHRSDRRRLSPDRGADRPRTRRLALVGAQRRGRADRQRGGDRADIVACRPLSSPPIDDVSAFAPGIELPWPRAFADLRGLATVSRRLIAADRLCGLTPSYIGMLQRQLARFFTWRDLARHDLLEAMVGRRIEAAVPLNTKADRWRVALTGDDGSSVTVELRTQ